MNRVPDRDGGTVAIHRPATLEHSQGWHGVDREAGNHLGVFVSIDVLLLDDDVALFPRNIAATHESPARRRCIFGKLADMTAAVPDWQEWYDAHAARLLLFARQWLPERADAEDAVQIGFVKFWRNRPRPGAADVPLLFAAVRSAALDLLRARTRRERRDTQPAGDRTTSWWDADTVADEERAAAVQAALAGLPIEQREVVTLRIWGGLTFADIARTLDANINTVTARFRSARAALALQIPEACRDATE